MCIFEIWLQLQENSLHTHNYAFFKKYVIIMQCFRRYLYLLKFSCYTKLFAKWWNFFENLEFYFCLQNIFWTNNLSSIQTFVLNQHYRGTKTPFLCEKRVIIFWDLTYQGLNLNRWYNFIHNVKSEKGDLGDFGSH